MKSSCPNYQSRMIFGFTAKLSQINCWLLVQGTDMRLCTAEVHEAEKPRKLGRGVELRRIEVSFSFFHK